MEVALEDNELIAEFLGYKYSEKKMLVDNSECGGIYDEEDYYSKVPIQIKDYGDGEKYFADLPNPDYLNVSNPKWNPSYKELSWKTLNFGDYITDLSYHSSWDALMPVVKKIFETLIGNVEDETFGLESKIKKGLTDIDIDFTYKYVVEYIKWYKQEWK
jgi:hypothetical protein